MGDTHNGKALNSRQMMGDRSSTRIFAPPGGHSSFSIGGGGYYDNNANKNTATSKSNKHSYGNSSAITSDALDSLVNSIPGLNNRKANTQYSADKNDYAGQLRDQIDTKRRMDDEYDRRYDVGGEKENFRSNKENRRSHGDRDNIRSHTQPRNQDKNNSYSTSYADQLKEQIELKRRIDEDMEIRHGGVYSGGKSGPSQSYRNENDRSYHQANHITNVRSAPAANGRRGQNAPGGTSTFSFGW